MTLSCKVALEAHEAKIHPEQLPDSEYKCEACWFINQDRRQNNQTSLQFSRLLFDCIGEIIGCYFTKTMSLS